jgi:hypothetical protein
MNIDIEYVIKTITKNINLYLENDNIEYKIIDFNDYLRKTDIINKKDDYYFIGPDIFFESIGKSLIYKIKDYIDNIYNIRFIQKNNIIEETNLSFSFECIYINTKKEIQIIKIIIHIFQYNNENCILKIMPLCNITSKSIYVNIKKNTKVLDYITDKIKQLNLKNQCTYYPKTGKNKDVRCKNEFNNETKKLNILLCNKHKRFFNDN